MNLASFRSGSSSGSGCKPSLRQQSSTLFKSTNTRGSSITSSLQSIQLLRNAHSQTIHSQHLQSSKLTSQTLVSPFSWKSVRCLNTATSSEVAVKKDTQDRSPSLQHLNSEKYSYPVFPKKEITVPVTDWNNNQIDSVQLDPAVFDVPVRRDILQRVVVWQLAKRRQGTACAKTRGEVRGSGRKVRPQKKTGVARAGDKRPPHWRGGGVAFPPKPRDFSFKLNKKVLQLGAKMALTAKFLAGRVVVVDKLSPETSKTKEVVQLVKNRGWEGRILFVDSPVDNKFRLATNNMNSKLEAFDQKFVGVYSLLYSEWLVITREGLQHLQQRLTRPLLNQRRLQINKKYGLI